MNIINVNNNLSEIIKDNKLVLVDFYANWCGPCKMLSPIIEELSNELSDITFAKVDVDENSNIAGEYKVMSIPTIILFEDGKEKSKTIGFMSKSELVDWINNSK